MGGFRRLWPRRRAFVLVCPFALTFTGACSDDGRENDASQSESGIDTGGSGDDGIGEVGGPKLDSQVDSAEGTAGGDEAGDQGCKKVDFLFVVDSSPSMEDEQDNLLASFPGFITAIEDALMIDDFHVMVIDASLTPGGGCDGTLGAGRTTSAAGQDCGLVGGTRYANEAQPDLIDAFTCMASRGFAGDANEQTMNSTLASIGMLNGVGECNEGFLRDDAVLVVTLITDEEDSPGDNPPNMLPDGSCVPADGDPNSNGDPQAWKDAVVTAKHDDQGAMVVLALIGDCDVGGACEGIFIDGLNQAAPITGAEPAPRLREFAMSFQLGSVGPICADDFAPFFADAVSVIASACDDFRTAGLSGRLPSHQRRFLPPLPKATGPRFHPPMRRLTLSSFVALACSSAVADENPFVTVTADDSGGADDAADDAADDSGGAEDSSTGDVDPSDSGDDQTTLPGESTGGDESGGSSDGGSDVCGDGIVGPSEACDGTEFDGATCATQGFMSGELVCSGDCSGFSTDGCYVCGDGEIQGGEQCDTVLDDDITCESEGFTEGEISRDFATCQFDTSGCTLCGNGVVEGAESCDSDDLGGATCVGLGFDAGDLACAADTCGFDYAGCEGGMYIQDFEGGAIPGEFALSGAANWSASMTGALGGSWSAVSGNIGNNGISTMTLEALFSVAGTVEFNHAQSTEDNYDYLRFYVDGVQQGEWDGIFGSTPASFPVAAGMHTLEWSYSKDGSLDEGSDQVWVDDILLTNGAPTL